MAMIVCMMYVDTKFDVVASSTLADKCNITIATDAIIQGNVALFTPMRKKTVYIVIPHTMYDCKKGIASSHLWTFLVSIIENTPFVYFFYEAILYIDPLGIMDNVWADKETTYSYFVCRKY